MELSPEAYPAIGDQINTTHINWMYKNHDDLYGKGEIWGDEARWTKFHAASWHALRNDNWVNMGFSPKVIAQKNSILGGKIESDNDFLKAASAYSALIDMLTLGGRWGNPMQIFDYLHVLSPEELGFSKSFISFWLPMLNQLGAWMNYSHAIDQCHPFKESNIIHFGDLIPLDAFDFFSGVDYERNDAKWNMSDYEVGGYDVLHLSHHSLKPLQIDHKELKLSGNYSKIETPSYSGWAYRLLNSLYYPEPALVRVSVKVHYSMESLMTLGHFLITRGETPAKNGASYPVQIRYVNDKEALLMLREGSTSLAQH